MTNMGDDYCVDQFICLANATFSPGIAQKMNVKCDDSTGDYLFNSIMCLMGGDSS